MPTAADLLRALDGALTKLGCRWYVFGAQALAVHGRARHTEDVDATVEIDRKRAGELMAALRDAGFGFRVDDPEAFLGRTQVIPLVFAPAGMDLDLIVAGSGLESRFLDRAERRDLGGIEVPVLSAEDFVVAKVLAQRPKDLEDVRSVVLARRGQLDLAYIRGVLGELEEALAQSDLLPVFEELLQDR